jgi:hypothetical protein
MLERKAVGVTDEEKFGPVASGDILHGRRCLRGHLIGDQLDVTGNLPVDLS